MNEEMFGPKDKIIMKNEWTENILYIARGAIIEKDGEYMDNMVDQMRIGRGRIACLQNLIADSVENRSIADVYCHHSS